MILSLLKNIAKRTPVRQIYIGQEEYLTRYYLFGKPGLHYFPVGSKPFMSWLPFTVYLHNFHRGDDEKLHTHPWQFAITSVLNGGYEEDCLENDEVIIKKGKRFIPRFFVKNYCHRITKIEPDTWTLFIVAGKVQPWGFMDTETKKIIPWKQYLRERGTKIDS